MTYSLIRSKRKTLAINIKPDGAVEVRVPLRFAKRDIERFVVSKSEWIAKKQAELAERTLIEPRELSLSQYAPGEFECIVREFVKTWEQRLDVTASFIIIRQMSMRWGSCTSKTRRIRLNAALEYCPRECLEYIVVHELAHIRESNHSAKIWAIAADALLDYKARQTTLKNENRLLRKNLTRIFRKLPNLSIARRNLLFTLSKGRRFQRLNVVAAVSCDKHSLDYKRTF
jgi:predicted metal-dependent hydrolase